MNHDNMREDEVEYNLDMEHTVPEPNSNRDKNRDGEDKEETRGGELSVEQMFESQGVPSWREQLTWRAFGVSFVLSILFSFIVMKLNLTTGIIPSLNVSAGLLGFFFVRTWTKILEKSGLLKHPFTRQENTVIQTCVVAYSGIAFSGGFGSYLSVVPLRKIMIIHFKLTYPSGTATAHLINSFHTPEGAKLAKKQVRELGKFFSFSFLWAFFQWFFKAEDYCGFSNFPTFGLKARDNMFFFDFSATYVGVGMICPYIINISVLLGGIISWGLMWPLIDTRKGHWYPADLSPKSLQGLQGYKVFIAISLILGDGLYNFCKVLTQTVTSFYYQFHAKGNRTDLPVADIPSPKMKKASFDDQRRTQLFLKDQIPTWFAITVIVIYLFAPTLAFCNAYGCGLTDWSLASTYGKLAIFTIGAWAGASHGGVLAGLAASSPRSMFVSQVIGTAMGCVISPCVFWLFYRAFHNLGLPDSEYPVPYAVVYRNMAILGVEGFSSLPKNCLLLCCCFFGAAILINLIKDRMGKKWERFVPLPMAMAIPFYLGPYFAIDMYVGSLILFIWEKVNKAKADAFAPAVASGLICGDGIWALPSSILALAGVNAPICMRFFSRATNSRIDQIIGPQ
ncbi:hypothetical protein P3X46_021109 [Hevea brasiliensis]|uniref:Metal-nicotianamine transporter YSL7 n=1 Tax=Hevea brasiliensis TaxID=3981 RepID=A0ABQ9LEE7_HEVBR|nr:hypothetical protein P3X46_021109 [Hevea brasiliensis]